MKILIAGCWRSGTRHVTIEAFRNGVSTIALNRFGMDEKVPPAMLVSPSAGIDEWIERIEQINSNYESFRMLAKSSWETYDTQSELARFEKILMR